jgi:tRNA pseudouridine55 synthase
MVSGILLVDKPAGPTSHSVVAAARKKLGTRRVGHAGTLDPMATGLLVLGVEQSTKLLTFLVGQDKTYLATIRLGQSTVSDDAESEVTKTASHEHIDAVTKEAIEAEIKKLTGEIMQTPSQVSAIKVAGKRAYELVRDGESVELKARPVTVSRFEVEGTSRESGFIDLSVEVDCSSGTYIRALARDLGEALGIGGHLTALRRTRVGPFRVESAIGVEEIEATKILQPAAVASQIMPTIELTEQESIDLGHGKRIKCVVSSSEATAAIFKEALVAIVSIENGEARVVTGFLHD